MKQRIVYTVKSNRQLGQDAGNGAIGGGRGWACAGGRAIGGDALAMQVHAGLRALTDFKQRQRTSTSIAPGRVLRRLG